MYFEPNTSRRDENEQKCVPTTFIITFKNVTVADNTNIKKIYFQLLNIFVNIPLVITNAGAATGVTITNYVGLFSVIQIAGFTTRTM